MKGNKRRNKLIKKGGGKNTPPFTEKIRKDTIQLVKRLADSICEPEGIELVHIEYQREQSGRVLRVYLDRPGGITLDDCISVSRQLSDMLDIYKDDELSYHLEVTSPGRERPLAQKNDFKRFRGQLAKIRVREAIRNQKNFTGEILDVAEESVNLLIQNETVPIPFQNIAKARLVDGEKKCL